MLSFEKKERRRNLGQKILVCLRPASSGRSAKLETARESLSHLSSGCVLRYITSAERHLILQLTGIGRHCALSRYGKGTGTTCCKSWSLCLDIQYTSVNYSKTYRIGSYSISPQSYHKTQNTTIRRQLKQKKAVHVVEFEGPEDT